MQTNVVTFGNSARTLSSGPINSSVNTMTLVSEILKYVGELFRVQPRVDWHGNCTRFEGSKHRLKQFRTVALKNGDTIPFFDAGIS